MKFAIACALLLALLGRPAAAADDDRALPPPAASPTPGSSALKELTTASAIPSATDAIITLKTAPKTHRFFDVRNSLALASLAATLSADALSTQKGLAYPGFREMNPIARPFVQTRPGAAVYSGASFALLAGMSYVAHKTQHHRLERILPFAVAGWEGWLSARNYRVIANNRR